MRETKRQTKTTSKSGLALNGISYYGELRGVGKAGCKIYSGAPTVSQTTGWIRDEMKIRHHVLTLHTSNCVEVAESKGGEGRGGTRRKKKQRATRRRRRRRWRR